MRKHTIRHMHNSKTRTNQEEDEEEEEEILLGKQMSF
jgi:hypothetical protein